MFEMLWVIGVFSVGILWVIFRFNLSGVFVNIIIENNMVNFVIFLVVLCL